MAVKFGCINDYSVNMTWKRNVGDILSNSRITPYAKNKMTTNTYISNTHSCNIGIDGNIGCFESVTYKLYEDVVPIYMPIIIGISPETIATNIANDNNYTTTTVACLMVKRIVVEIVAIKNEDDQTIEAFHTLLNNIQTSDGVYKLVNIAPNITFTDQPALILKDITQPQDDFVKTTFTWQGSVSYPTDLQRDAIVTHLNFPEAVALSTNTFSYEIIFKQGDITTKKYTITKY